VYFKFTHFFCLTLPSPKERVIGGKFEMHPINDTPFAKQIARKWLIINKLNAI
jgi:hypothetical protein